MKNTQHKDNIGNLQIWCDNAERNKKISFSFAIGAPIVEFTLTFNLVFYLIRQRGEKIMSGQGFDRINAYSTSLHTALHLAVRHYKTYSTCRNSIRRYYDLEKFTWDIDLRITYIFNRFSVDNRATYNIDGTRRPAPTAGIFPQVLSKIRH